MKNWFKSFWTDPVKFKSTVRTIAIIGAGAVQNGVIPLPSAINGWVVTFLPYIMMSLGFVATATKVPNNG